MTAIIRWGGGLVASLLVCSASFANPWTYAVSGCPIPAAPDACGPGWYSCGPYGMVYGPNYYLRPPFPPFQGMIPGNCGPGGGPGGAGGAGGAPWGNLPYPGQQQIQRNYPSHPYARGPRDFFMWTEYLDDLRGRDLRPNLVP